MDKYSTLEPVRLHGQAHPTALFVGKLPTDLHLLVLSYLPIPDFPAYSRCSHATSSLAVTDKIWQSRLRALGPHSPTALVLDHLENVAKLANGSAPKGPATIQATVDDEFGDFETGGDLGSSLMSGAQAPPADEYTDFVGAFDAFTVVAAPPVLKKDTPLTQYIRAHSLLKPLLRTLSAPPHLVLNALDKVAMPAEIGYEGGMLMMRARILDLMAHFLSDAVRSVRNSATLMYSLRGAIDRFDSSLLTAFDDADSRGDERIMKEAAEASWTVYSPNVTESSSDWELGKVWTEKREIFYEQSKWDSMDNFTEHGQLVFDAMDEFMSSVVSAIVENGSRCARVFPQESGVLLLFAERLANEVVGEYITSLLTRARELSNQKYLVAVAATFREASRMVDAVIQAGSAAQSTRSPLPDSSTSTPPPYVTKTKAEDVIYKMYEMNMDEYLDEEVDSAKLTFDTITNSWAQQQNHPSSSSSFTGARITSSGQPQAFLASQNPAQMKRNLITSFTDVLLLPVTIVPRTVNTAVGAVGAVGGMAFQGISMLNPQRWVGGGQTRADPPRSTTQGYTKDFDDDTEEVFNIGDDDDDDDDLRESASKKNDSIITASSSTITVSSSNTVAKDQGYQLDLFISLDVALELIHADRESLKRVETFISYPGHYGHRVRDTMEEIFILMLHALGEGHTSKGFSLATEQMSQYKPSDHALHGDQSSAVAQLVQFFELVHIADTMQSMVQVYYDKEIALHIDRTDFLNAVVREKGRFENALDDCVAAGLNTGTDVLMNQVEHIILTLTKPREYYPPEGTALELGPTEGCTEAIKCLETHCRLLKGSTSKEVLEVFHQEVGIRLIAILQKHIKRQIISLSGGFQVIADLNTYHAFVNSLKIPTISSEFAHLKMLGHVYVVEDAKDLAQIVRDVTRYGGAYRPEDIYEFIQRRSDWKSIEKTVDKTMYNLSFKEDCTIC